MNNINDNINNNRKNIFSLISVNLILTSNNDDD